MPMWQHISTTSSSRTEVQARSTGSASNLPQQILEVVPLCAQPCVSTYISETFAGDCAGDLECLCSEWSSQGFTLGELAYICITLGCTATGEAANTAIESAAYGICNQNIGHVSATHGATLIPPPTSSLSQASATTSTLTRSSASSSVTTGPGARTTTVSAESVGLPPPSATPTPTMSSSMASATGNVAALSHGSSSLTSAQAVGVSIAAVGGLLLAIGLIYLVAWIRRRDWSSQSVKHDSYDFIDKEPPVLQPLYLGRENAWDRIRDSSALITSTTSEDGTTRLQRQRSTRHDQSQRADELTTSRQYDQTRRPLSQNSRRSIETMQTISQLLPDRPAYVQRRVHALRPPRVPPKSPRHSAAPSQVTVFEEDRTAFVPGLPANPHPAYRPYKPTHVPQAIHGYDRPREQGLPPSLTIDIPQQPIRPSSTMQDWPLPPPPLKVSKNNPGGAMTAQHQDLDLQSAFSSTNTKHVNTQIIVEHKRHSPTSTSTGSASDWPHPTKASITKPAPRPGTVTRSSSASDTSFESADADEATPPAEEEGRQLTPVVESSPIAGIRYPKIPRSSNQAVPRSPILFAPSAASARMTASPDHLSGSSIATGGPVTPGDRPMQEYFPPLTGSTLAPRQHDDSLLQTRGDGLRIIDSRDANSIKHAQPTRTALQTPPESPLHGYGNGKVRPYLGARSQSEGIARPIPVISDEQWKPRLTPQRQGNDLFLRVSAGTPKQPHF